MMKNNPLYNKRIILGITGSIAAYKGCEIVRGLKKNGADVRVIMTRNATNLVGPLTFQTLSQHPVLIEMFECSKDWTPKHIELAEWAEAMLIAPATANIIGKAKTGIADDLLSSTILSVTCPVIFGPAMNERMYENTVVQENIEALKQRGYFFVGPDEGFLAEGYEGKGRLAETKEIIDFVSSVIKAT